MEELAIKEFVKSIKESDEEASVSKSGVRVDAKQPFLAASPDGIFKCKCHGEAVVEVKCPFSLRGNTVVEIAAKKDSFLTMNENGEIAISIKHAYYYQIQLQMHVCSLEKGVFITHTRKETVFLFVNYDKEFTCSAIAKAKDFYLNTIMPELLVNWFSRAAEQQILVKEKQIEIVADEADKSSERIQSVHTSSENANHIKELSVASSSNTGRHKNERKALTNITVLVLNNGNTVVNNESVFPKQTNSRSILPSICTCKKYMPDERTISCVNENCDIRTYHVTCLGYKRIPKNFRCKACRKLNVK